MGPDIHELAQRHLSGDYTVERVEFTDGDTRTRAKHTYEIDQWTYVEEVLWKGSGSLWMDYYENFRLTSRRVFSYELQGRVI